MRQMRQAAVEDIVLKKKTRGFRLSEKHVGMIDWMKYMQIGDTLSEIVGKAVELLYKQNHGPSSIEADRDSRASRVSG